MRSGARLAAASAGVALLVTPYAASAGFARPCPGPAVTCGQGPAQAAAPPEPGLRPYRGLGTWVDGYDFSRELGGRTPPSAVDDMAAQGVRTLYLQAAMESPRAPGALLSPDLLAEWVERAHARGMHVVAWYLPELVDPARDWRHLRAILRFRTPAGQTFDGVGVDIEARDVRDPKVRGDRLVALSARLRRATDLDLAAIVVPPVLLDEVNPAFWPGFPWRRLAPAYDVWIPMAYFTDRTRRSGHRDAYRYTVRNVDLLRRHVGAPDLPVHVAGGLAGRSDARDHDGLVRGARHRRAIGVSSYDYATTSRAAWAALRRSPG